MTLDIRGTGPIYGPVEGDPNWLDYRKYDPERTDFPIVIGASEAAAACNRSHYDNSLGLYLKARGELEEQERPREVRDRMRRGKAFQNVIVGEYSAERGWPAEENNRMFIHPTLKFMGATPDAFGYPDLQPTRLVEVKGTTPMMFAALDAMEQNKYGEEGTDIVPDEVLFQTQQQLAVMDLDECDVVVFFGLFVMRVYTVPRNDMLVEAIVEAEQELVERIADGRPPEPHWTHPRTRELISQVHGLHAGVVQQLSGQDLDHWLGYQMCNEKIKILEGEKEEHKNRILWSMGGAETGRFPMGTKELHRTIVKESIVTEKDVEALQARLGTTKRRGYEKLTERKVK